VGGDTYPAIKQAFNVGRIKDLKGKANYIRILIIVVL
jgi:hypothetical protein